MASICRRKGRWFAQVRRSGFPSQSRTFDTKAEATAWAATIESQLVLWNSAKPSDALRNASLGDLIGRYLQDVTAHKLGRVDEQFRLNKVRRSSMASIPIGKLTPATIAAYRDSRLTEVAPSTVQKELNLLQSIVKRATHEWGLHIPSNPFERVARPRVVNARERRVTVEEMSALRASLTTCRNPYTALVVAFAIETGMRRGEILQLKWTDIDGQSRLARLGRTKNGHSRLVPLSCGAIDVLTRSQLLQQSGEANVFPISVAALKHSWKRLTVRSGISDLHFHDLRHEAISRFFELGLSVAEVSHISGHRDPRMLFRYTHLRALDLAKRLRGTAAFEA